MLDVVTMKFGPKYPAEWANRLLRGVARNITVPHKLFCFTDDPEGLDPEITPIYRADLGGWWNHLWAFSGWTTNNQMMLDVDDVVVGSLDELAAYTGPHALNSDVYRLHNVDGGFQLIPPFGSTMLWHEFMAKPKEVQTQFNSDKQFYIARINDAPRVDRLFPGQVVSYKVHCQRRCLPVGARVVSFHGLPKPDTAGDAWIEDHWR